MYFQQPDKQYHNFNADDFTIKNFFEIEFMTDILDKK